MSSLVGGVFCDTVSCELVTGFFSGGPGEDWSFLFDFAFSA
ncbi:MAG: hypothetical protein WDO70_04015 [Alphaproteobacteria bacterium]